ncbi:MAG TPA: GAF domain-containing protein [Anaerolineales bacterium]|nr:GAF domain-containing protein [Anaerolineales bacterium]
MTVINPPTTDTRSALKKKGGIRSSIRTKITFWTGLLLTLVSLILLGYSAVLLRQRAIDSSTREVATIAEASALSIKSQLDLPHFVAHTLAISLSTVKDPAIPISLSREQVNAMLRKVLIENPSFLGTYTLWEPNAFDGVDYQYIRAVAHDESGRFIPYWVRGDDGIIHTEALAQYEVPGVGDWYLLPRATKKSVTLAPLIYSIQGKDVVMASFIVPIIQDDKFYGIAGVDAPIGFVQELVDSIDLYDGSANAVLFTNTGTLIAVRQQPELTSQPASLIYEDFDLIQPRLNSPFTRLSSDGQTLQIFYPVNMSDSDSANYWVMGLIIPFEKITAPATTAAVRQAAISTGFIVLALVFLWFFAGQIVRPMQVLTTAAQAVSEGNLNATADVHSNDEAEVLADAFNSMTAQLRNLFGTLEQRVAARTRDLEIVAEVGTATATILESQRLLQEVVDLTKERFNLYHSHIYLLDAEGKNLILAAGAGEPGRQMLAKGLSIPLDREQSLVARAAREHKGVTVNDVMQAPDFLPNPLLPDTRSELAVPMLVGGNLIGVFDIQSDQVGRFTAADVNIQTTMAAQLATSVQNVRSFEHAKRQAEFEAQVSSIGQKIQQATSMEDTLQTAIREIGLALGARRVSASIGAAQQEPVMPSAVAKHTSR